VYAFVASLLVAVYALAVAGFVVRLLARDDMAPATRLAWTITFVLLPYVGLGLYLLIGERRLRRGFAARYRSIAAELGRSAPPGTGSPAAPFALAAALGGFAPVSGNRGAVMADGGDARARLVADIDAARASVDILYYIWLPDRTGAATAEAVMRAARRGVRCRVMVDALGSRALLASPLWSAMREAGAETLVALPYGNPLLALASERIDLRNHRKIAVIDEAVCHCGSQNCADEEFLPKARYAPWVDIMLRIEGPAAAQMALLFELDYRANGGLRPCFPSPAPTFDEGFVAQAVGTGPVSPRGAAGQLFCRLIFEARSELVITTPYFVPDEPILAALATAAGSGVEVTLIVPRRNDSRTVAFASRSHYARLLASGVRIYEFEGGLLHAKTLTIDASLTFIGSSNLDIRSLDLNFENDLLFLDAGLTAAVRARQQAYCAASREVTDAEVAGWPIWRRVANNAIATVSPIL
jgi:cardiolipin synthase